MTVSTTLSKKSYSGNDTTVDFSFPYIFYADTDLVVLLVNDLTGVETPQVLTTHYTVSGAGDEAGGTVTMITPPANGETLVIYRLLDITQETDYISGDDFPAQTHEQALDRLTLIAQQIQESISRTLRLSDGTTGVDFKLPAIQPLRYFRINAAGDALELTTGTMGSGETVELLHIEDRKPTGQYGGTFNAGDWRVRDLNTIVTNQIGGASLDNNRVTLPVGNYWVEAQATAFDVFRHKLMLWDNTATNGAMLIEGMNHSASDDVNQDIATLEGRFTLSVETELSLKHRCEKNSQMGFGIPIGGPYGNEPAAFAVDHEKYASIKFWRYP